LLFGATSIVGDTILAGETKAFTLTVSVLGGSFGALAIDAQVSGTEEITGDAKSDVGSTLTETVQIQTPSNVYVDTITIVNPTFVLGQNIPVDVRVQNTGGTDATVTIGLLFDNAGFVVIGGNITAVVPAGSFIVRSFVVDSSTGTLGTTTVDAAINGTEQYSGTAVSDVGAGITDSFLLVTSIEVEISGHNREQRLRARSDLQRDRHGEQHGCGT